MRPEGPQRNWNRCTLLPESSPSRFERSATQVTRSTKKHRLSLQEFDKLGNTFFGDAHIFWPKTMLSSHALNRDYDPSPQRALAGRKDFSLAGAFQGGFPEKVLYIPQVQR